MDRAGLRRVVLPCLCLLALGSCTVELEKARVAFTEDSSGQITFRIAGDAGIDERIWPELIAEIRNCGFDGRTFERGTRNLVDAQYDFDNQTIMNSNLDCLPLDWSRRDVSMAVSKGLLFTTYTTRIWIEQPMLIEEDNSALSFVAIEAATTEATATEAVAAEVVAAEAEAGSPSAADVPDAGNVPDLFVPGHPEWQQSFPLFPKQLTVRVPGKVDAVSTRGTALFVVELAAEFSSNQATIEVVPKSEAEAKAIGDRLDKTTEAIAAALERGEKREIPLYSYKVEIESSESHVELSTVFTLLGLLFGSGLIGRLLAVRSARSRKAPAES